MGFLFPLYSKGFDRFDKQQELRRNEIWVAERDSTGASNLLSFSEYNDDRYDKEIRKRYLQGRLGGIPRLTACRKDLG
jgi:uncharacterized protein